MKLEVPDLATRRAIVKARPQHGELRSPTRSLDYIAEHLRSSVRELEGAMHSLIAPRLTDRQAARHGACQDGAARHDPAHRAGGRPCVTSSAPVCQLFQIDPRH